MVTKERIFQQLADMNAPRNGIVLVHSSLKAVGEVEGRGEGLLNALIEYFTSDGGLLCVPTHTWAFLLKPDGFSLDMQSNTTCIGVLPSIAAGHPDGIRSVHPTHSMVVFGDREKAEALIRDDGDQHTPASPESSYGKIYDNDGYILLMGVGHDKNTYIHCVEEMLNIPNRFSLQAVPTKIRLKNGDIIRGTTHYHFTPGVEDVSAHYTKFEPAFRHYGIVVDGYIGNAKTQLLSARKIYDTVKLIYGRNNYEEVLFNTDTIDEKLYK